MQIWDVVWEKGLRRTRSCSIIARHQLIQVKVMHEFYYSKIKLHRIILTIFSPCDRCKSAEGSLTHLLWTYCILSMYIFIAHSSLYLACI